MLVNADRVLGRRHLENEPDLNSPDIVLWGIRIFIWGIHIFKWVW